MADDQTIRSGGCMCGAVRYETAGTPSRIIHCHCTDCRKHTGAAVATLPVFAVEQVLFHGSPRRIYASSENTGRGFCPDCGATLTFEADLPGYGAVCAIHISSFDRPEDLAPTHHSFYASRLPWFDVADDLPRHAGLVVDSALLQHGPSPAANRES